MAINFKDFQALHGNAGIPGRSRKRQSDQIMLGTWDQDIQSQTCYIYDFYHDQKSSESLKLNDLHPQDDPYKIPLDIKFIRHTGQTYDKDPVTFWLQMKPGQKCNVDYYGEVLGERYDALFPIALFADIADEDGSYNKWLIVDKANYNGSLYPTFEILRCDFIARWIYKGHKYQCPAVLRSQNSYNAGIWRAYKTTEVEDQQKFAVPMARETETLFYNIRMIIDGKVIGEPRAWHISKVNRISPNGIARITLAQDTFDQHNDYIERDDNGNVVAMWANYFKSNIEPTFVPIDDVLPSQPSQHSSITSTITCSGKPQFKIGGSAKTLTVTYSDKDGNIADMVVDEWIFKIGDEVVGQELLTLSTDKNKIKVKFLGDDSYIGKILTVTSISGDVTSSIDIEIIAL